MPHSHETTKPADLAGAVGDSSPRTDLKSLPRDTSRSPHAPSISPPTFNTAEPPAVREEQQPVSQTSSGPLPLHSAVPRTQEGTGPPVAPNTATSVFAFNFPTLAKARPPPETVVASPPRDTAQPSCKPFIATPGMDVLDIL